MPKFTIHLSQEITRYDYATLEIEATDEDAARDKVHNLIHYDNDPIITNLEWEQGDDNEYSPVEIESVDEEPHFHNNWSKSDCAGDIELDEIIQEDAIGEDLILGMENAVARTRGQKRAARETVVPVAIPDTVDVAGIRKRLGYFKKMAKFFLTPSGTIMFLLGAFAMFCIIVAGQR